MTESLDGHTYDSAAGELSVVVHGAVLPAGASMVARRVREAPATALRLQGSNVALPTAGTDGTRTRPRAGLLSRRQLHTAEVVDTWTCFVPQVVRLTKYDVNHLVTYTLDAFLDLTAFAATTPAR